MNRKDEEGKELDSKGDEKKTKDKNNWIARVAREKTVGQQLC